MIYIWQDKKRRRERETGKGEGDLYISTTKGVLIYITRGESGRLRYESSRY